MPTRSRPAGHSRRDSIRNAIIIFVILFVLAGLLYPAVAEHRRNRRWHGPSSLANVKHLGQAMLEFAEEHEGRLPSRDTWAQNISPYLETAAVFRSPADPTAQPISYAMVRRYSEAKLSEIPSPTETPILYEAEYGAPADWANGGLNVLFADGHAKWYRKFPEPPN